MPIRQRRGVGRFALWRWAPVGIAAGALVLVAATVGTPAPVEAAIDQRSGALVENLDRIDLQTPDADAHVRPLTDTPAGPSSSTTTAPAPDPSSGPLQPRPVVAPSRPLRVLVVGDSTAVFLMPGLGLWGEANGYWQVANHARIGCGIVRGGERRGPYAQGPIDAACSQWPTDWPEAMAKTRPDIVVLATGFWDLTDRRIGDDIWRSPGDPVFDEQTRTELATALDVLGSTGATVVVLRQPPVEFPDRPIQAVQYPGLTDRARMDDLNDLLSELAALRPNVRVVDVARFFDTWPGGVFDPALRPDLMHLGPEGTKTVATWLAPEILDAYWSTRPPG